MPANEIKFSIPYNGDLELIRWAIGSGKVHEVYFVGSKGNDFSDPYEKEMNYASEDIRSLVRLCKSKGVKSNMLINKSVLFFENLDKISGYIESLNVAGGIDSVTISDIFAVPFFRKRFPGLEITSSVYMSINSAARAVQTIKKGVSILGLEPSINRNEKELRKIASLKKRFSGISIKLLGNHICYADCIYYVRHSQLPVLNNMLHKGKFQKDILGYALNAFSCHYGIQGIRDEIARGFIRPEDVGYYEKNKLTDFIKIAFRNNPSALLREKMTAYFNRHYDGNLFPLFDSNNPNRLYCDNKKIPADFINKVMSCDKNCEYCDYCETIAKRCITRIGKWTMRKI